MTTVNITPAGNSDGPYPKVYATLIDDNNILSSSTILERYASSDLQSGATSYFGFLAVDGSWYIMKKTLTEVRYIKGDTDYTTNWTNRAVLSYDYFNVIFG